MVSLMDGEKNGCSLKLLGIRLGDVFWTDADSSIHVTAIILPRQFVKQLFFQFPALLYS